MTLPDLVGFERGRWGREVGLIPVSLLFILGGIFMLYRFLAPIPLSVFITVLFLRVRWLLPFVIAHWLMDGGDVFVTLLCRIFVESVRTIHSDTEPHLAA